MSQQLASQSKVDWRIINWLRGLAAFYVIINHSRGFLFSDAMQYAQNVTPKENWAWWEWIQILIMQFTTLGSEFVIMFFILSGFSMAHSLRNNPNTWGFYKRRLVRLYPTYLVGLFWGLIVYMILMVVVPAVYYDGVEGYEPLSKFFHQLYTTPLTLLANLFYLPIDNYLTHQYWSLPFEVIFYLLAPLMVRRYKMMGAIVVCLYIIGWAVFGMAYRDPYALNKIVPFCTDYAIYFLVGILFYRFQKHVLHYYRANKNMTLLTAAVLFGIMYMVKGYGFDQVHNKILGMFSILLTAILLFGSLKNNIRVKWLERIGIFSYTLYVTHLATLFLVKMIAHKMGLGFYMIDNLFVWYAGILFSVGFAYLLFYMGEYQSTQYLEKLRSKKKSKKVRTQRKNVVDPTVSMAFKGQSPAGAKYDPLAGQNDVKNH